MDACIVFLGKSVHLKQRKCLLQHNNAVIFCLFFFPQDVSNFSRVCFKGGLVIKG